MGRWAALLSMMAAGACGTAEGPPISRWGERVDSIATAFTVRLPARDPETQAVVITRPSIRRAGARTRSEPSS